MGAPPPTICVIVPAFQSARWLGDCLDALAASSSPAAEVIVVDDGSTDGGPESAALKGARVIRVPEGPRGPAFARNLGARATTSDVLMFVDADVAVHGDTLARVHEAFTAHANVAALFGSYDDRPRDRGLVSSYRNLLHHYVHQVGRREATTFWAGCGAVRRTVFAERGGFDERYTRPSIEDIELGDRLHAAGQVVWLDRDVQATHLKHWSLWSMVRADIRDRAIPWTRLIVSQRSLPTDLNVSWRERLSAAAAWLFVVGLLSMVVDARAGWMSAAALVALVLVNRRFYALLAARGGVALAIAGTLLHLLYFLYSSATFVAVAIAVAVGVGRDPRPRRRAETPANTSASSR